MRQFHAVKSIEDAYGCIFYETTDLLIRFSETLKTDLLTSRRSVLMETRPHCIVPQNV